MKAQTIKELLKRYKNEIDFIDFDDDLEILNMFSIRNQLIDRLETLEKSELNEFWNLDDKFIDFMDELRGFEKEIVRQNAILYVKTRKLVA